MKRNSDINRIFSIIAIVTAVILLMGVYQWQIAVSVGLFTWALIPTQKN